MSELFSAGELINALLKVGKNTYKVGKFVGKASYGAYRNSKDRKEMEALQREAAKNYDYAYAEALADFQLGNTAKLEKLAGLGHNDARELLDSLK